MGDALLRVHGDFGCVRDSRGWNQFSPFWLTALDSPGEHVNGTTGRRIADEWAANWKARGYTHVALTPRYSYSGSPIAGRDFSPSEFVGYVERTLNAGFAPILMLTDVPSDITKAIEIVRLLKSRGLLLYVICVPGWEVIPTREWTSRQVSDFLIALKQEGGSEIAIGMHLQPGRWSFASHPLEADDPWQGGEQNCWKSHGGEHVNVFLYQTEHDGWDAHSSSVVPPGVEDRWRDGVPRMGNGMNGWRVLPFSAFETILYNDYRNQFGANGEPYARKVAARLRDIAAEYGVTVGYGNGCP